MKLNKIIREGIVKNAVEASKVYQQLLVAEADRDEFTEACRVLSLGGPDVVKHMKRDIAAIKKRLSKYPGGVVNMAYFDTNDRIEVRCNGERRSFHFPKNPDSERTQYQIRNGLKSYKTLPSNWCVDISKNDEMVEWMRTMENALTDAQDTVNALRIDVAATVNSVTTVAKLLEI